MSMKKLCHSEFRTLRDLSRSSVLSEESYLNRLDSSPTVPDDFALQNRETLGSE